MESEELVEVYTLKNPSLAEIIKGMLQSEGIPCFIDNNTQAGLTGILDATIMVRAADADRAKKLIESHLSVEEAQEDADD